MKKTITALSLVAALFTASTIPAASASPAAPELPAACAGLVTDLAGKLTKTVSSLLPLPNVAAVTPLIGDMLNLVTAMQSSGCLPTPPVSVPGVPLPAKAEYTGPVDQCLPVVLNLISSIAGLGGTVLGAAGGALPDVGKLTGLLTTLLKTVTELLSKCGLPAPPGGLPALPGLPLPVQNS
ncbi:hypothetical protein SAMN04488074_111156 [Lentzea albidocapillata subsp. violacea]|uniref:Secreted protein n=1 Tax=Lentzea albidocapillata subsp. violacea TaxID=128104 RepID=A0A1G9KJI2_9PSEU|nr:hypothetical protein [Lentzea albidocapillata]SDL49563.1 hypothetical protein SAMN04488074_111156 [Lentzea albidocapillata subsp. violacea]